MLQHLYVVLVEKVLGFMAETSFMHAAPHAITALQSFPRPCSSAVLLPDITTCWSRALIFCNLIKCMLLQSNCKAQATSDCFIYIDVKYAASNVPVANALCSSIDRTLPFELRALEAALAHTCRSLEQESIQVERATLPSLKALMQKVSPAHNQQHICHPCTGVFDCPLPHGT